MLQLTKTALGIISLVVLYIYVSCGIVSSDSESIFYSLVTVSISLFVENGNLQEQ